MDATNDDDAAMMAMMGLTGFGTTKVSHIAAALRLHPQRFKRNIFQGKHVEGNQEGAVDIKKMRTWRQYMNRYVGRFTMIYLFTDQIIVFLLSCRRGGFNRFVELFITANTFSSFLPNRPLDKIK